MKNKIIAVGLATFFFGFGAGAILNVYLIAVGSPLVKEFRGSLTFISSIVGDGILLPIVNMIVVSFLLKNRKLVSQFTILNSVFMGFLISAWFHITQAVNGLTNWTMPQPWHWNFLGWWHALYMLSVTTLLSLFLITAIRFIKKEKRISQEIIWVILGILGFLVLLRMDYMQVSVSSILPGGNF